jgi:hypothetical protein
MVLIWERRATHPESRQRPGDLSPGEEDHAMGDKGKGKDRGKASSKKPKAATEGRRSHELRQRESLLTRPAFV